jgi:hypothetical protein
MPSKNDKIIRAYRFFAEAERDKRIFTLEDVADASGWSIGTTRTYKTKKWHFFLKEVVDGYICYGIGNVSQDAFIRIHAQRTDIEGDILRPRFTPAVDALIDKAREAALLAVQVYNNPLVSFRTPGFIVHMVIAYTSILHAVFERNGVEYWYKNEAGTPKTVDGDKYAWDINACIRYYYEGKSYPEEENIKFFVNIRNKIEHRFIPALDITFSGKCQALLMNFEALLINEFGKFFVLGQNLALALQFSVYSAEQQRVIGRIQAQEYELIRKYSEDYDAKLPDKITQSMHYSFRAFLIPKIGNHASSSDVAIEFVKYDPNSPDEMASYEKQVAFIRDKQVQVADQGKLRASDVVRRVRETTGLDFKISHHTNAWKLYKVRLSGYKAEGCNVQYCQYSVPFRDYIYTEAWIKFLIQKVSSPDEFNKIKNYRED